MKTSELSNKQQKNLLNNLNNEIAKFAKNKQLTDAQLAFKRISAKGLTPNIHSYTNLLNGYARCGESQQATKLLDELITSNIGINLVTLNIACKC